MNVQGIIAQAYSSRVPDGLGWSVDGEPPTHCALRWKGAYCADVKRFSATQEIQFPFSHRKGRGQGRVVIIVVVLPCTFR